MKENKISLSTFFLIIAIIVMGIFIFKLYSEKTEQMKTSSELQTQTSSENEIVNNLQTKVDNIVENNTTINTNNNNISFTEEQVKKTLSNYLELRSHANCDALLVNLTEKGKLNYNSYKDNILNNGTVVTTIKFVDYKNAMLNYVSESEFEKNWTKTQYFNENSNGYLTKTQGGGSLRVYTVKSITKINESTYSAKTTSVIENEEHIEEKEFTFTVTSYNGNCVIDTIK